MPKVVFLLRGASLSSLMFKKATIGLAGILFFQTLCFGYTLLETGDFSLSLSAYLRNDVVTLKNVTDLDSNNKDDSTTYFGIDYSFDLDLKYKEEGPEVYLKMERNGPFDYDAPLFADNALMTSGGGIEEYRKDELLPNLEEFWLDAAIFNPLRLKIGLYAYEVGYGFALNGAYENYGLTLYRETDDFAYRFYYCRPDAVYKNHLGPRIRQDEEQGVDYNHNAANFFAADLKIKKGNNSFQPYIGVLADYTSSGKRGKLFTASVNRDILGTAGLYYEAKQEKFSLKSEFAHNFGKATSADAEYKDIAHTGYLFYSGIEYYLKKFTPTMQFLFGSGNKVSEEMALNGDTDLVSGKNRAFSCYSPLNTNFSDSIGSIHADISPIVAMGSGYGLNYGVSRPQAFAAADFDNLMIIALGLNFDATEKLSLGLDGYYLRSAEKGTGTFNGEGKYLSKDLGEELDFFIDYQFNENIKLSFLSGYFFPGKYYKEERDDPGSLFSPCLRGDGKANSAYQIELSMELKF